MGEKGDTIPFEDNSNLIAREIKVIYALLQGESMVGLRQDQRGVSVGGGEGYAKEEKEETVKGERREDEAIEIRKKL